MSANSPLTYHSFVVSIVFLSDWFAVGGKKAVEVHAAVWVPDGDATVCMHCKKTQFTLINRRVRLFNVCFFILLIRLDLKELEKLI